MEIKNCENCKNQWSSYVCPQAEKEIESRIPCGKYKEYPHGITPRELIKILEKLPQDAEINIDCQGTFAIIGAKYNEHNNIIFLDCDLIGW